MSAGPTALAMRLSNGELADRLKMLSLFPNRYSVAENKAIIEEAADRLDTKNKIKTITFDNDHVLFKFCVNGMSYFFPEYGQAEAFVEKVRTL